MVQRRAWMEKRRSQHGAEDEEIEVEGNPFEALHFPPARKFGSGIYRVDGSVTRKGEEKPNLYDSARLEEARAGRLEATKEDVVGKLLFNFRDLKDATNTGRSRLRIKPGRVYRTACIARGDVDIDQIAKIIAYIKDEVGIRTIIDFRNKDEKQADPFDRVLEDFYPTTKATTPNIEGHPRRFHIPLMNLDFKLRGLFNLGTNKLTKLKLIGAALPVGHGVTPTEVMSKNAMNVMGLLGLNQLMLVYCGKEIAQVLRLCTDPTNYPIMYHCSSGKDRTGLITALILRCCEADTKDIIANYHESEIALDPVMPRIVEENREKGLDAGFDGTPPQVMHETLKFIKAHWGYTSHYLDSVGFPLEWQHQLRDNLTKGRTDSDGSAKGYSREDYECEQAAAFQKFLWDSLDDSTPADDGTSIARGVKAKRLAPAIAKAKTKAIEKKEKKAKKQLKEWKKQMKESGGKRKMAKMASDSALSEKKQGRRISQSQDSKLTRKEKKKEKKKMKKAEKEWKKGSLGRKASSASSPLLSSSSSSSFDSASESEHSPSSSSSSADDSSSSSDSDSDDVPTPARGAGPDDEEEPSPPPSPWARRRRGVTNDKSPRSPPALRKRADVHPQAAPAANSSGPSSSSSSAPKLTSPRLQISAPTIGCGRVSPRAAADFATTPVPALIPRPAPAAVESDGTRLSPRPSPRSRSPSLSPSSLRRGLAAATESEEGVGGTNDVRVTQRANPAACLVQ